MIARANQLAHSLGLDAHRLLQWAAAFAPMNALEIAEASEASEAHLHRVEVLTALATAST